MGDTKLSLLLLLSTLALAHSQDDGAEEHPTCLLARRYKSLHKYEYQYEAQSLNAIEGASNLINGPKCTCKVEIEVPQSCSYILRTTGCSLSEVVDMDAEGNPVFGPAPGSDAFAAAMEKHPLKVVVERVYDVKLYPEEDESMTILNIKRGIVSALAVPLLEEENNKKMPTIHGMCKTNYIVNAMEDIATDITLNRDLSKCDHFIPQRDHTSPLALISGMHYPLAQLIRSSQTCNYKFDNDKKHMISGACTEKHILVPFSHKGEYGVTNVGKQFLTLLEVSTYNERVFNHNVANLKGLPMEAAEDKSVVQDKDAPLAVLRELATLSNGEKRAHLFQQLVSMVRGMKAETLSPAIPEALKVSGPLTYQVLAQCGTPECSSAIMQILRTFDNSAFEVDAVVFAMGLVPNPSALLVNDMLAMARYKQSKPILYALSNVVKRFYKAEGKVTPEIEAVAEFAVSQLGDCTGDKEQNFLALRVIGNMAAAMGAASPALKSAVIQCVNEPVASLEVQQAAIQAFRQTPVPEEGREVLMQVLLSGASPLQKRVAAYLVLMKDPQPAELAQLAAALPIEEDQQAKSFVISHLTNILASTAAETQELRQKILDALQGNEVGTVMDPTKFSRNYMIGSVQGNMLFEGTSYLPKEVMLEMTLKAFGYNVDMVEVGMEGKGLETTVEALFGENGFFPDTVLKTVYFVSDKMPLQVNEVMKRMMPALKKDRMKRQASQNIMREIGRNLNKLVRDLKTQESPEAMVYLRLLGNELGYLKTNEMEKMAYSAGLMIDNVLKMFPTDLMKGLMTNTDNEVFAHYIFMDNEFFLPTATGVPLKIALSGTFTPGIKGGLHITPDMSEVSFMPSAGIEFVARVGSHIPEYLLSGLEMHTSLYHESGLSAKIAMADNQVKLTIPAPQGPAKLISITNKLFEVTSAGVKPIPSLVEDRIDVSECTPFLAGMKYCTTLQYSDASSHDTAPYFPFTGDSKLAVELHPTGEVTEYTATIGYELLREGEEGRQKVDTVKMVLKAEGADPTEATATVKYNRRKNVITTDIQIPDFDLEAGIRLGVVDGNTKGKGIHSISIDLINKNIPQLSLVGRAKIEAMKDAMLQVQLLVPSIKADATFTANVKRGEELELELESDIKLPETTSVQKITLKYDDEKIVAEVKSDMNSEIQNILPHAEAIQKMVNDVLDQQVGQTDMKVRHILTKSVEATNNYLEKYAADIPYMQNLKVPGMPEMTLPEKLFLNVDATAAYHFNNERIFIAIPLPLGGKSSEELNFPAALTTPHLALPQLGLDIASMEIPIPELFIPETLDIFVPLFGKTQLSTKVKSNFYNLEGSVSAGKDAAETPSYSAKFDVTGSCSMELLCIKIEGSGLLATTPADSIKAHVKTSVSHKFIDASISIREVGTVTDNKINVKSSSKIEATSPMGLSVNLEHTGQVGFNSEAPILAPTLKISGDSNLEGTVKAGPVYGTTITTQSFTIFPFRPEAVIDSSLKINSTILKAQNTIAASFANGELSVVSNTNAFEDILTHAAELAFKDNQLSLKCDTNALALGMKIHNQAEASVGFGAVTIKMETNADHSENRIYSLVTASLDVNGLAVNSDGTVKLLENKAAHKATLTMNKAGLATSGTTTLQGPFTMENTFNGGIDSSKATLSIETNSALNDMKVENANSLTITLSSLAFNSKAEAIVSESTSYTHDITIDLQDYTASVNMNNNLKLLAANLVNEAQLKAVIYKIDFTGSLKAAYGEEELKHTYEINYADLTANAKCSTNGKLLGAHMSHNIELEIVGLAAKIHNDARFNSQPFRFDNTIRASIIPFDFNLDAIFNADGDLTLYGKQSAQLYGKFLLKAQPLAFASSHECRASVTQQLDNGFPLETTIDNKIDTLLTPQEQRAILRMKSKLNNHALNQEVSAYNNAERLGLELSATLLTGLLNTAASEEQEFTISGFLKYDKNTDSHLINLPFLKSLPAILENIKITIVNMAEAIQNYINSDEVKAKLEALPHHVSDFVAKLNLEGKAVQLKQNLIALTEEYAITLEYLEASLVNLKIAVEKLLMGLASSIQGIVAASKEMIASGTLSETVIERLSQELNAINEEYKITTMIVAVIDAIEELIKQIDMQKLKNSSISLLHDIDAQFEIKAKIENAVSELKQFIENFDRTKTVEDLRNYISSINLEAHVQQLMEHLPTEVIIKMIESVKAVIQELDIIGKLNVFHAKLRGLIVKYEVDKKVEAVLEKVVGLIKQFKIDETIQVLVNKLKAIDIPAKVMQMLEEAINSLKAIEIKQVIEQLNEYLDSVVQQLRSFDYNAYVDETNQMISEYTAYVNELIKALEIPQKLQASREFVNFLVSSALNYTEHLRKLKVADMIKTVKDVLDHAILNEIKAISERLKQGITNMDLRNDIISYLQQVSELYTKVITVINEMFGNVFEVIQKFAGEQQIVSEVKQIIEGVVTGLKTAELDFPSFTIPLTDLVMPSMKVSLEKLQEIDIPTQLDIPEFTILGFHTVPATTVSFDDIKQKVTELIDFIFNFEIQNLNLDVFFGDLTMSYLPTLPDITLPEITFPEFYFPVLPKVVAEKLLEIPTLQIPEIKLPAIPSEISVPCFGKLYGEIKVSTPIYSIRTSAELQNSTDSEETPQLTAFLTSQAISPIFEIFSYNLDSTARVAIPKLNRVIVAETLKFTHTALAVEHQASVTLYRLAAQASAKTTVKATTAHYTADIVNNAFFATLGGMSASVDTTYNHQINIPILGFTNGASVTQKAVARLEDTTITLNIGNDGAMKFNFHEGTHKCDLHFAISPSTAKLTISADTDTALLKMKQTMNADAVILSHITFEARSEAEGIAIKNSLLVASGNVNLGDMKVELKANHDTELVGGLSGILSNSLTVKIHPIEVVFDFQNKGNTKLSFNEALMAKIDLHNDYSATIKPEAQQINTVALARFNQYKSSYNFTIDNNEKEAGIFATMNGEANLEFLTNPISIPEIDLPFINMHIPAISDLNLYEHTGLKNILTTTEQSLDVDSKILYQKSHFHSLGNLITELSLKSPIFNLNANAGLYAEDDLVFRLGATTASIFEALKIKLDGTTSLTTKRGLKLATALSLENAHIEGNHDSTFSLSPNNLEVAASVATIAKIALPIFNLEANQQFVADTKTKPNAASTLKLKGDFNLPLIKAIGKAEADHSLKLEGTLEYISVESSIRGNIDGTILEYNAVLGALDNEANMYLNTDGLRSTSKIIANAKLSNGETTILEMDVDENLAVEASVSRVYAVLKFASNNEANVITFNTKGKHVAQATIDFAQLTSLTADVEIDMSQPSNVGDISLFEKTVVELTGTKQKISTTAKIATPVYTTNLAAELKGDAPVFKAELKSSATSVINFLDYDMDASFTASFENEALSLNGKAVLTHADLTMDIQNVITQAMRKKRQEEGSVSRHTLNVDITSPTFTDVNFRYAARRDGVSASISTPSTGFLGLQLQGRIPSQLSARLYSRYASAPEDDVDILVIRATAKDADKIKLQVAYNMEAPHDMLLGLKERLPAITSTLNSFSNKYEIFGHVEGLKSSIINLIEEAYTAANSHAAELSQLSILFRNTVFQFQKTIQVFLDAAIKFLRETEFKLPGSEEITTLPKVLKQLTTGIATMVEQAIQVLIDSAEASFNALVDMISDIQVTMPIGDVMTGAQIIDNMRANMKHALAQLVGLVKHLESLDIVLEKLGETLKVIVEKAQEFVDTLKSDYLDAVAIYINALYDNLVGVIKTVLDQVNTMLNMEQVNIAIEHVTNMVLSVVNQLNLAITGLLQQASEEAQAFIKVSGGRLEIELPFPFHQ
ncbi:apolipoprotein B-100 isoform X2 [Salmo trutta]|uniref:apolipoprotein B-100 isoform X2 n=2 Tax=Salmo trutta TaxID=8032 RepID=UPI0011306549|nr:apolipoprotein B-100-like isoform X2 [Salmo trutta]